MSPNALVTRKEVQAAIWAALKWVLGVGLALAFSVGAWASTLRADVNRALDGTKTVAETKWQLDSLRIEVRHMSATQDEMLKILRTK